ncbi:MAG: MBL fold metallo-hydrolase [Acidobacteria bacterium]|nr:MBL fold metallo-hydrolase [Acidobacteriota bacterium]
MVRHWRDEAYNPDAIPRARDWTTEEDQARQAEEKQGKTRKEEDMRLRLSVALLTVMAVALVRAQMPTTTRVPAAGGDIVITALGHASVQLEQGGKVVIVDPVSGQADLSKAKQADLILVTDIHPDHFDPDAIAKLRKPGAPVVVPPAVADTKKIPNTIAMLNSLMRTNESALAGITVISVPAYNLQRGPAPGQLYHPRGRGQGYLLTFSPRLADARIGKAASVYVAGDTECVPAMAQWVKDVDVALMPMNLPYTMTPAEAAACVKEFKPKVAIPYHYMGQKPEEFAAALKGGPIEVRLLDWYAKGQNR